MEHAFSSRVRRSIAVVTAGLASVLAASAQSTKISGPFTPGPSPIDVTLPRYTPDGSRLLYEADGLYSVPADGSAAPVLLAATDVAGVQLTPDSTHAVYTAGGGLWSVFVDGSQPAIEIGAVTFLNDFEIAADSETIVYKPSENGGLFVTHVDDEAGPQLLFAETVVSFHLSPDGQWVVYRQLGVSCSGFVRFKLGSIPVDGSAGPTDIAVITGGVELHAISPDSQHVVYSGRPVCFSTQAGVFTVPIGGGTPLQLGAFVFGLQQLAISSDGARVVHVSQQTSNGPLELFSVPADGSAAATRLNPPFGAGAGIAGGLDDDAFEITPDGTHVAYTAVQTAGAHAGLYAVPIEGGASVDLSGSFVSGGDVITFRVGPSSLGVVFLADKLTDGVNELFAAPLTGGAFRLNAALVAGGQVVEYAICPDDQRVAYRADRVENERFELYSVPTTGGLNRRLNGDLPAGGDVTVMRVGPASDRVAFIADQDLNEQFELFSAPIDGATPAIRLNDALPPGVTGGDVDQFEITATADAVVYLADAEVTGASDLYRAPIGGGSVSRLSGPSEVGEGVWTGSDRGWRLTADGSRVVYVAGSESAGLPELFSVEVTPGATPIKLNDARTIAPLGVESFQLTPDGVHVVYQSLAVAGGPGSPTATELYVTRVDGTTTPLRLSHQEENLEYEHQITADGQFVFFQTLRSGARYTLYRVPLDGSTGPVQVNDPVVRESDFRDFVASGDGRWVVYRTDARVDGRFELFRVELGTNGPVSGAVKLNTTLPVGGDVTDFAMSSNGEPVLFRADQRFDERFELFAWLRHPAQPLPGGTGKAQRARIAPVRLGSVPAGSDVEPQFVLAPGGGRVLFVVDDELYLAATDGGTAPTRLTTEAGPVFSFTPDGTRIVFETDSALFSVPSGLGQPPVELNATGCDEDSPRLGPDGDWVLFRSHGCQSGGWQLYTRPVDGASSPLLLNGPMQSGGNVLAGLFAVATGSGRAVYIADQDTDGVFELYSSPLPSLP